MCSVNWRVWEEHGVTRLRCVFNRDESVKRASAIPPQRFSKNGVEFLMPIDPEGQGSWIALNNAGFIFFILNDYQGKLKTPTAALRSRGELIKQLASCKATKEVHETVEAWSLAHSQPFFLGCLSVNFKKLWHFDGISASIVCRELPEQWYSSGHPEVIKIIEARRQVVNSTQLDSLNDLIALHRSHQPDVGADRTYSFCMHRKEARSQSMTVVEIAAGEGRMDYWPGQPCEIEPSQVISKALVIT